jgi:N-acetylneuraminate synthase/N,N'-diacetyllegionaminate synthase
MNKVIIIAEAGVNHNGDIELAKKLIDIASDAKVDYVKFQTWITEDIVDKSADKADYQKINDGNDSSQFEMLKRLELSFEDFIELKKYSEAKDVEFLSTADDYKSLDFLSDTLDLPVLKIGSGEVTNIPFLRRFGQKKKPIILSTGMSTIGEVEKAYYTLLESGAPSVLLLHCTSNYPAPLDSVNLKAMNTLSNVFNCEIGYSDHTEGIEVSFAAVALGATVIEKHFTINKDLPGPDHKASLDGHELKELVRGIRNVESAISGDGLKKPHKSEIETKKVVQKGIYLNENIRSGDVITDLHLIMKRPVGTLSAQDYDFVLGKKVKRNISKGEALKFNDLNFE